MVEEHIQAIAERQRHDGRGRVVGRLPATRRARPGGARQVREGSVAPLALRAKGPGIRQRRGRAKLAAPGLRLLPRRAFRPGPASGMPSARRGGLPGAVGRAGRPVHPRLRIRVRMADDGRRPEDRERFPAYRVEGRRRHRQTGRRPAGVLDAVHVRRVARDRCGRDRPQEGPRVHHRHRRPRARTRDLGARRARQTGPRPVLPTTDAGAARVDPDRDRRRGRMDRLVRGRAPPKRRTRARLVPHRLLDDRRARPGRETVVEPGQARREHNGDRGDARRQIRRAREPRRPDRTPIHGPRHTRRRGSQGPATARGSSGNSCASPSNGPKRNSNDGSAGRPAAASPRSSNHAGRSADAATTSSQPSGSAVPTPGSKRSTTRSRSPSAWPTASATRTTSSP